MAGGGPVEPSAGLAFLGAQGDVWDAQKAMAAAAIGAVISLLIVALVNWHYDPAFGDKPLGEQVLWILLRNRRKHGD